MPYYDDRPIRSYHEAARLAADVGAALAFLHASGYVHCDVKRSNVRFSGQNAVLIDFDLATEWREGDELMQGLVGTQGWMAPEVAQAKGYSNSIDMWGLGLVLLDEILKFGYNSQGASHIYLYPLKCSHQC